VYQSGMTSKTPTERLLERILLFCERVQLQESSFGFAAVRDPKLVRRLKEGQSLSLDRAARIEEFMTTYQPRRRRVGGGDNKLSEAS